MKKDLIIGICITAFVAIAAWAPNVLAYQFYSEDVGTVGGCAQCHGAFRSGTYISPADGSSWGTHLHNGHLNGTTVGSNCNNCHYGAGTSGRQVNLSSSAAAADGVNAISCSGCHGRLEDAGNGGYGVGLRLHHINAGAPADSNGLYCNDCHNDSAPVGEDVMSPWYASITNNVTRTTLNSCNVNGAENFAGTAQGNDNDGDLAYDSADSDCVAPECTENADCDDGLYCNGAETCDGSGTCQPGTEVDCNDGIGCTDDSCDEVNDTCVNAANDANCPDDGQFCTGAEYCDTVTDCDTTGNPCQAGETCNEGTDTCDQPAVCGNGIIETGETCDDGAANGTTTCGCQSDCTYAPAATSCADGLYCNGDETCDGAGSCQSGTPVTCDDGVGCTEDICDEVDDACVNIPDNTNCSDDGSFCNGTEFCDEANDCSSTGNPCQAGETCNEGTDTCDQPGVCGDGTVDAGETCDDGVANGTTICGCQSDCTYAPASTSCADGLYCNGDETCDGAGACQAGAAVDCNDGVGCTDDSCDETNDTCINAANDANCPDDGQFCTGTEYCDVVNDCSATGDPCQAGETCNEGADTCDALTCADLPDKGTCQADPNCEWVGKGKNASCQDIPPAEDCTDGIDNDGDGLADCDDPDCAGIGSCPPLPCAGLDRSACQNDPTCEWNGKNKVCSDAGGGTPPPANCSDYNGDAKACRANGCSYDRKTDTCSLKSAN